MNWKTIKAIVQVDGAIAAGAAAWSHWHPADVQAAIDLSGLIGLIGAIIGLITRLIPQASAPAPAPPPDDDHRHRR